MKTCHSTLKTVVSYSIKRPLLLASLLVALFGSAISLRGEGQTRFCPIFPNTKDTVAMDYARQAKVHFANWMNVREWPWFTGNSTLKEDFDFGRGLPQEILDGLYLNHMQHVLRITSCWPRDDDWTRPAMSNTTTYSNFAYIWLENFAKPLVKAAYERGIYIIDYGHEQSYVARGDYTALSTYEAPDANGMMYFGGRLAPILDTDFEAQFIATCKAFFDWKNQNYPKVVLTFSLAGYGGIQVATNIYGKMGLRQYVDWAGTDSGACIMSNSWDTGTLQGKYNYWKPQIEDANCPMWGIAECEAYMMADYNTLYSTSFIANMEAIKAFDPQNYIKLFVYLPWQSLTGPLVGYMAFYQCVPYPFVDTPLPLGSVSGFLNGQPYYNVWGPSQPSGVAEVNGGKYNYLKDNMHSGANSYWDSDPQWPLMVRGEDIKYDPVAGKVRFTVRNVCASNAISAPISVYERSPNDPPWHTNLYVKTTPENIDASLDAVSKIAYYSAGSYAVAGNGNLTTTSNTMTFEIAYTATAGKKIFVYIDDTATVKGWTAANDIPACYLYLDDSQDYDLVWDTKDSVMRKGNTYNVQVRARSIDQTGNSSPYDSDSLSLDLSRAHKTVFLSCAAADDDGIKEIIYEYSINGTQWHTLIPQQNLVVNGDFEEGSVGWAIQGAIDTNAWGGLDGTYGVYDNSHYGFAQQYDVGKNLGRADLKLSLWAYGIAGATLGAYWVGYDVNDNYVAEGQAGIWGAWLTDNWCKYEQVFTLNNRNIDHITLYFYRSNQTGSLWMDEVVLSNVTGQPAGNIIPDDGFGGIIGGEGLLSHCTFENDTMDYEMDWWIAGSITNGGGLCGTDGLYDDSHYCIAAQYNIGNNLGRADLKLSVWAKAEAGATLGAYWVGYDASDNYVAEGPAGFQGVWLTDEFCKYTGVFTLDNINIDHINLMFYRSNQSGKLWMDEMALEDITRRAANLLNNGGFNEGTDGWAIQGALDTNVWGGVDGTPGIYGGDNYGFAQQYNVGNNLGRADLKLSLWSFGIEGATLGAYWIGYDANDNYVAEGPAGFQGAWLTDNWCKYEQAFTLPNINIDHITLMFYRSSNIGHIWIDEVVLEDMTGRPANLLNNGGFNNGTAGWVIQGSHVTEVGLDGTPAIYGGTNYGFAHQYRVGSHLGRADLKVSVWAVGEAGATLGCYWQGFDVNGILVSQGHTGLWGAWLTDNWCKYEQFFRLDNMNIDHITLGFYRSSNMGNIWIDEAVLEQYKNGAFNEGAAGWHLAGSLITEGGFDGGDAVYDDSHYSFAVLERLGSNLGRADLKLSLWAKGIEGATLGCYWQGFDENGGYVAEGQAGIWGTCLTDDYCKYTGVFTLNNSMIDRIRLMFYRSNNTGKLWMDHEVVLENITPANLLNNGVFDEGAAGWYLYTNGLASAEGLDGTDGVCDDSHYGFALQYDVGNNLGRADLKLSLWAKAEAGATLGAYWVGYDASDNYVAEGPAGFQGSWLTDNWCKYEQAFTLPNINIDHITLQFYRSSQTGKLWMDEVALVDITTNQPRNNLLNNGGFNNGTAGWAIQGALDTNAWGGVDGTPGIYGGTNYGFAHQYDVGNNLGRADLKVSVWSFGTDGATLGCYWQGYDENGNYVAEGHTGLWGAFLTGNWCKYEQAFTLPNINIDHITLGFYRSSNIGNIWIDEASLEWLNE
ncbi:MAG: hypothetical protein ABIH24_09595 [Verrucomicrobiota bacterium]